MQAAALRSPPPAGGELCTARRGYAPRTRTGEAARGGGWFAPALRAQMDTPTVRRKTHVHRARCLRATGSCGWC